MELITEKRKQRNAKIAEIKAIFENEMAKGAMKMPLYQELSRKYNVGINTIMRYVNKTR